MNTDYIATDGFAVTASDTVDIKNDTGNTRGVSSVLIHNVATGATVRVMPAGQSAPPGFTLTGTSGTANITINGTAYLATFSSTLTVTATNFAALHLKALAALGITVRSAGVKVIFTGARAGTFAIANVSGNLSGTALADTPVTIFIPQGETSKIAVRRVYNSTPTPPAGLIAFYPAK
jgi:hypothetical protein